MKDKRQTKSSHTTFRLTWMVRLLGGFFILCTLIAGVIIFRIVRELTASYQGVGLNPFEGEASGQSETTALPDATPTLVQLPATPQPWDGKARVTLLVMGVDFRDWLSGEGAPRTDTMLLATIDPITLQAGMLSIPRDLWVEIPGFGFNRINTAYMFGEAYNMPGGGPALATQTVENLIGVPVNYYAVIQFHAFERMIDEIGGVEVEVTQRIRIAPIDGKSQYLDPGPHLLDGPDALAYARVRKGAGDDFGRAGRQQQVAMAVLERLVRLDLLPSLIGKAPTLYQELATGVRTNLTLEQMVSLAWLAIQVPQENIRMGVISPPKMVGFYTRPDGASVLRAVTDQIRILRDQIFTETSAFGPSVPNSME